MTRLSYSNKKITGIRLKCFLQMLMFYLLIILVENGIYRDIQIVDVHQQ